MQADLVIENGTVLTMDAADTVVETGGVAISGGRIQMVGDAAAMAAVTAKDRVDAAGGLILPGLVNTHTHGAMTLFRGLADDLPLMSWLHDHIFPAESRLTEQMVTTGAKLACLEMIASGTTTFCDMYLFEDGVATAAKEAGMRAVVGEVLYDFPSPNYGGLENGFRYVERMVDRWKEDPLITVAVEPHSPYLCAPELLQRAFALAETHDLPFVIHLSETRSEVAGIREQYGKTPTAHLADLGVLSPRTLAAHCVVMEEEDIRLLAETGTRVSHNPESNMKLASGIAPVPAMLKAGICVGLGTDGAASNNDLDLLGEMDTTAKLHKVATEDPTVTDARTVLRMATIEGAKCLGMEGEIGSLETGKQADVIVVRTDAPHMTPLYNPCSHLVYTAGRSDVSDVVIAGRIVYRNHRHCSLDPEAVRHGVLAEAVAIGEKDRPKRF